LNYYYRHWLEYCRHHDNQGTSAYQKLPLEELLQMHHFVQLYR
jgi:hypothetical protein